MHILGRFKKYILAIVDAIMVALAYGGAYIFLDIPVVWSSALVMLYISVVTYLLVFLLFGVYNHMISFASAREYIICFFACVVSSLLCCAERTVFRFFGPNRQLLLAGVLTGVLCIGVRVLWRVVIKLPFARKHMDVSGYKRLLIVGAGDAGHMIIRELIASPNIPYKVIGLIDDDQSKIGCRIYGIKVLGDRHAIPQICKAKRVDTLLFAIPTADGEARREILDICNRTNCQVHVLPGINEMISGKPIVEHMRKVSVCDLLSRDPVRLNNEAIGELVKGKVVLVTGGGGSIGSELCRQIARYQPGKLLILDIYENNAYDIQQELKVLYPDLQQRVLIASVRDRERLEEIFEAHKPSLVFHAAAHKHVPLMESDPREAIKNNIFGTLNVAECADRHGVKKFILISTDKAVNPTNVMGATKRYCEMIIQDLNTRSKTEFVAVRFGNVLGSNGSVIPLFQRQIASGGPVTVTHKEITRFFMTIPEAAQLVMQAASYAAGGEIFVLDMGEPVKIYDLAVNLIKLSGYKPGRDIEIKITGLRPGEKLYEELMMEEEGLVATQNEKIFITQPFAIDSATVQEGLAKLEKAFTETDNYAVKKVLGELVTTYSIDQPKEAADEDVMA
ncbi:MAG: polysaccharide biosynthesis protein [Clostridia bacterium]|nr:polysaccharide biosynthesis protein [Clostridia bacterium]